MTSENKKKILVIDDNRDAVTLFSALIEKLGHTTVACRNGTEGVKMALDQLESEQPFDLILCDIFMPGMDGYEMVRKIREGGYEGPVVAFTALATGTGKKESQSARIDAYFSKQVLNKELLGAIIEKYCR